jgi:Fur family ferric uptake transcriptional regulator
MRDRSVPASTQAVYDMLAACTAAGLPRRIEPAGHPARFESQVGAGAGHPVREKMQATT